MFDKIECPICNRNKIGVKYRIQEHIECNKCGRYSITRQTIINIKNETFHDLLKVSSWISEQNKVYDIVEPNITTDKIDEIKKMRDKTIKERFNCFIKTFSKRPFNRSEFYNHCYISSDKQLDLFFEKALEKNYIKVTNNSNDTFSNRPIYQITFDGLEYIESLSEINKNSKNIFVAFHFNDELKSIFDNEVKSAIEELDFNYVRVSSSTTDTNMHINDDIIGKIKSSKIVIADFTEQRQSVYFEAGFAMGLNISVIWSCRANEVEQLSFDTRQYPHILWTDKDDFTDKIIKRIKAIV